jgi:NAD(P)-dependent dehydrogenase (short-subunit alcohol dehydrogenase family)
LNPNSTYAIIGGTGGLGCSMASWMVKNGAKHIVLLSRSESLSNRVERLIENMARLEANVTVQVCDVTIDSAVQNFLTDGLNGLPPLRGVIHSAMVLRVSSKRSSKRGRGTNQGKLTGFRIFYLRRWPGRII